MDEIMLDIAAFCAAAGFGLLSMEGLLVLIDWSQER